MRRMFGAEPDEALAEKHRATLVAKLDGYERILSKQKYLAGEVCYTPIILALIF